jgi:hypothetical protein
VVAEREETEQIEKKYALESGDRHVEVENGNGSERRK